MVGPIKEIYWNGGLIVFLKWKIKVSTRKVLNPELAFPKEGLEPNIGKWTFQPTLSPNSQKGNFQRALIWKFAMPSFPKIPENS